MLEPHELAAAMGFTNDEATYEFAGTKTEQIKQIGNAVSVEMMEAEVARSWPTRCRGCAR
jgi:DNA (cytosine-5)-methyltransferase 1